MIRLDKFLSHAGQGTRSEVRALLRAGRVFVDGNQQKDAGYLLDEKSARVALDGEIIPFLTSLHIMMNKPAGVLTAAADMHRQTVMDLLPAACAARHCMPVGRLDMDTDGLLLFTTDGALAHRLLSPQRRVEKEYIAEIDGLLDADDITAFARGIALSDFTARPARLTPLQGGRAGHVMLHEGKYHQVKRMFGARGKPVTKLTRIAFAGISLDPSLAPGAWRELTSNEVKRLYDAAGGRANA